MQSDCVRQAFASGQLLHPVCDRPSFRDLTYALARRSELSLSGATPQAAAVADFIGAADHIVFVLVDGMGWELLNLLPPTVFLRSQRMMETRAIFPSTTACALTTLATGLWPGQHGVPGWWAYLEERNLSVITLPFQERLSESPLDTLGIKVDEIWPFAAWLKGSMRDTLSIVPQWIAQSVFSCYARGNTPGAGYQSVAGAVDAVLQRIDTVQWPAYTFLYLPEFDTECHRHGSGSQRAVDTLTLLNTQLERLAAGIRGRARLVISADHGHADVPENKRLLLFDGDPLLAFLKAPPSAEARGPVFHVRDGCHKEFEKMFNERYSEDFALLTLAEVEDLKLLGNEPLSPLARRRFGDYMAIATQPVLLKYKSPRQLSKPEHLSHHAGLSSAEMRTPLIVV